MTRNMKLQTYSDYVNFLAGRDYRMVPSIRATLVKRLSGGNIAVQYHSTAVVIAHQDGSFTLNSGGYMTPTTKVRINQFSPARVYQQRYTWYLAMTHRGMEKKFHDGIRIDSRGLPVEVAA